MDPLTESKDNQILQKVSLDVLEKLDFDVIEDMPWAQTLWKHIEEDTQKGFLHWCKIVKSIAGTKNEHIQEWIISYRRHFDDLLCDMVLDILSMHKSTEVKIQNLFKCLQKLCLDLHQPLPKKIGEKKLSLFEEQAELRNHVQQYKVIIKAKKLELDSLHEKQRKYCEFLGRKPEIKLQYSPLPTKEQIDELQRNIDQLEAEKFEREEKYCLLKLDITEIVKELKYKPSNEFEKKVLSSDNLLLTDENMQKMELFIKYLMNVRKETEEEISQCRIKIEDFWKLLDVPLVDRDKFRTYHTGISLDTLDALKNEVRRCEEIKKANIKDFLVKQRIELESLWEKCHCSDMERTFKKLDIDCGAEELLDIYESEIHKWRKYYVENSQLLGLLEKHQELWKKVIELEEMTSGSNRYKNRGGKLLQEEKERNKLSKLIPKIEEEILELSDRYRKQHDGQLFLSFGTTPEEHIEHIHAERENYHKLKQSARKVQRDNTLAGRTPVKLRVGLFLTNEGNTPSSLPITKRKILATPNTGTPKRLKANSPRTPTIQPKSTQNAVSPIKISYATLSLPSQKRKSRSSMDKSKCRNSNKRNKNNEATHDGYIANEGDATRNTTYSEFQNELTCREQCRSTILPDQIELKTPVALSSRRNNNVRTSIDKACNRMPISSRTLNDGRKNVNKLSACKNKLKLLF